MLDEICDHLELVRSPMPLDHLWRCQACSTLLVLGEGHRWLSNEQGEKLPSNDVCLVCGVPRFSEDPYEIVRATSPCIGAGDSDDQ